MTDHPADCEICAAPRTGYDISALIRVRVQARDKHEAYTIAHQLLSPPPSLDDPHYVLHGAINGHPIEGQLRTYYPVEHRRLGDDA